MPTYEYQCDACGHRFDQFQSIMAEALRKCPACGKARLRRLIGTGGAVIFKGGGFYETDYRSEGYRKAEEAERKSGEPAGAGKDAASKDVAAKGAGGQATSGKDAGVTSGSGTQGEARPDTTTTKSTETKPSGGDARSTSGGGAPKPARSGKSHAREGRGVGNLKRTATRPARKSSRRAR